MRGASAAPLAFDAVRLEPQLMNAELGQPATPEQELAMLRERVAQLQQQLAAATAAEASAASDVGRARQYATSLTLHNATANLTNQRVRASTWASQL